MNEQERKYWWDALTKAETDIGVLKAVVQNPNCLPQTETELKDMHLQVTGIKEVLSDFFEVLYIKFNERVSREKKCSR